jgi:hypothetical protein
MALCKAQRYLLAMPTYDLRIWFPHTKYPGKQGRAMTRFNAENNEAAISLAQHLASEKFGHKVSTDFDRAKLRQSDGTVIWESPEYARRT